MIFRHSHTYAAPLCTARGWLDNDLKHALDFEVKREGKHECRTSTLKQRLCWARLRLGFTTFSVFFFKQILKIVFDALADCVCACAKMLLRRNCYEWCARTHLSCVIKIWNSLKLKQLQSSRFIPEALSFSKSWGTLQPFAALNGPRFFSQRNTCTRVWKYLVFRVGIRTRERVPRFPCYIGIRSAPHYYVAILYPNFRPAFIVEGREKGNIAVRAATCVPPLCSLIKAHPSYAERRL